MNTFAALRQVVLLVLWTVSTALASGTGQVYLFDGLDWSQPSTSSSVSLPVAELIFAKRLGLSTFYNLDEAMLSSTILGQINEFGGPGRRLFEAQEASSLNGVLLVIDGVKSPEGIPKCACL